VNVTFDLVVVDVAVVVAADLDEVELAVELVFATDFEVVELVVPAELADVDVDGAAELVAGGGIMLRLTVAPHSARDVPSGQHPASVQ